MIRTSSAAGEAIKIVTNDANPEYAMCPSLVTLTCLQDPKVYAHCK